MYGDLKIAFAQKALADYMTRVIAAMRRTIIKKKARVTDELLNSLAYQVYQNNAQANGNLKFAEWGRMVDMGVGRGHPLGGIKATTQVIDSRHKDRKPKKIYSPIVYGNLNGLIGDLMYGFTEETIAILKNELENGTAQLN